MSVEQFLSVSQIAYTAISDRGLPSHMFLAQYHGGGAEIEVYLGDKLNLPHLLVRRPTGYLRFDGAKWYLTTWRGGGTSIYDTQRIDGEITEREVVLGHDGTNMMLIDVVSTNFRIFRRFIKPHYTQYAQVYLHANS